MAQDLKFSINYTVWSARVPFTLLAHTEVVSLGRHPTAHLALTL
jgi:hypothetical protein